MAGCTSGGAGATPDRPAPARKYAAALLTREPVLDGIVADDAAWKQVPAAEPLRAGPAGRHTRFKLGYTAKGLYVAIECDEPSTDKVKAEGEDMDRLWDEDSIEVLLTPAGGRTYRAVVSAIGARYNDAYMGRGGLGDWKAMTFTGEKSWSAEVLIPFETLMAAPGGKGPWRLEVRRNIHTVSPPVRAAWAGKAPGELVFSAALSKRQRAAIEARIRSAAAVAGNLLAFCRPRTGQMYVQGRGAPKKVLDIAGPHVLPRILPGRKQVLFHSRRGGRIGVWVLSLADGSVRRICDGDQASCSGDGGRIVLRRAGAIVVRDLAGGAERTVSPAGWTNCALPSFLPDGRVLFVAAGTPDRLLVSGTDRSAPKLLATAEIRSAPRCSPDGRWIAYQDGPAVWLLAPDTGRRRRLTFAGGVQGWPIWSADSRGLCYSQWYDPLTDKVDVFHVKIDRPGQAAAVVRNVYSGADWAGTVATGAQWERVAAGRLRWAGPGGSGSPPPPDSRRWQALPAEGVKPAAGIAVDTGRAVLVLAAKADRAVLIPTGAAGGAGLEIRPLDGRGRPCGKLLSVAAAGAAGWRVRLTAKFASAGTDVEVVFDLTAGGTCVGITPRAGASGTAVASRFDLAVAGDRHADDLIFQPGRHAGKRVALPWTPTTHLLGPTGRRMVVAITPSPRQSVELLEGAPGGAFSGFRVLCGGQRFFLAVLTGKELWREVEFSPAGGSKPATAKWSAPVAAQWRLAGRRGDDLRARMVNTDTPVGSLKLPVAPAASVIYLYGRGRHSPLGLITPLDAVREAVGVRGAEKLLDIGGIRRCRVADEWVPFKDYRNTFIVLGWIEGSTRKGVAETVAHFCDDIVNMLAGLDGRIDEYRELIGWVAAVGAGVKTGPPGSVKAVRQVAGELIRLRIEPAADMQAVRAAAEKVKRAATRRGKLSRSQPYRAFRAAAEAAFDSRRRTIASCRRTVRAMRNRAGLAVAEHPDLRGALDRLRALAGETLRMRYFLEADWRGERPLNPSEVSYDKIKKW